MPSLINWYVKVGQYSVYAEFAIWNYERDLKQIYHLLLSLDLWKYDFPGLFLQSKLELIWSSFRLQMLL